MGQVITTQAIWLNVLPGMRWNATRLPSLSRLRGMLISRTNRGLGDLAGATEVLRCCIRSVSSSFLGIRVGNVIRLYIFLSCMAFFGCSKLGVSWSDDVSAGM